ncbi:MAG: cytosol nonspecific dipeptidase [Bacteroidetes bacterium RIFOXYA12_FULL_35_11]|nr:MAG: cytosol nonspecific dipeptidase [Bacteroidetes bacterium GWF2_35_48]OFY77065.1 MAG: cytosol nonspecific dipeptidase [Bacteroidetes bacterium RIFOXYA12_FULL_35_11]OFZ05854.1 MAG: cytosol nonspecific dipeptidase [Bacteroidetes bacterium RIFOXYC12_FULL_35_7]HBX51150.1 cytosol nonspecific dipeptidase [Bacteroidales bacterium]
MANELSNLYPKPLWEIFGQICNIPHPSKNEAKIIQYAKEFGEKLGLKTIVDEVGNVIIKKPATPGMENRMGIVLQGHLDMVPQKNSDTNHDFEKDPIQTVIDGEWVRANGTTLGADNGIGVAAAMAVLEAKDLVHGPVEVLLTIDEETGMTGAFGLKAGLLDGDILMNLDSEDEGELYIGCAGGLDATLKFKYENVPVPADHIAYRIDLKGLKGGHSGVDINLQRGNSNKLLFRFLKFAEKEFSVRIAQIDGGSLRNAIPRESYVIVTLPADKEKSFLESIQNHKEFFKNELAAVEPTLQFEAKKADMPANVMDEKTQKNLICAVYACPNGVVRMSDDMKGVVETSTNLAIIKSENGAVKISCLMRSSVDSSKEDLANMMDSVFSLAGAEVEFSGGYPGWKPNMASPILKTMQDIYQNKYGQIPEIKVIHAGLECGLLGGVYPHWDMISFGPTIRFPHSPDEKVHVQSVGKFWDFLVETLKYTPIKK